MLKIVLVLICATVAWAGWADRYCNPTANYCATSLCSSEHIGCQSNGAFASTCDPSRELIDITPFINLIVTKHNHYRNLVAGGGLAGFSTARRMGTMEWCDELSKLAVLNVKRCQMEHDQCRNTDDFKLSGQNLSWRWSISAGTPEAAITDSIDSWFDEYTSATMADIDSYPSSSSIVHQIINIIRPDIDHFTQMVNDRNIAVGCALIKQARLGTEYYFTCNYAQTNIVGHKTYVSGPVGSACTTGPNPAYPNLCSSSEPIDPNQVI